MKILSLVLKHNFENQTHKSEFPFTLSKYAYPEAYKGKKLVCLTTKIVKKNSYSIG